METNTTEETKPQEVIIIEEKTKNALSSVEQNNKDAISMIHENMEGLIRQANELDIDINNKDSYDKAVELKRTIKATHIQVEKRRKELKAPFIEAGKKLDDFVKSIYTPLKEAEQLVKGKCEIYEKEQERLKQEEKEREENALRAEDELNAKLKNLNGYLEKINNAKSQEQIAQIEEYLGTIDLKSFGEKSSDAGFIVTQLKMTCNMAKKVLPETTPPENLANQEFPTQDTEEKKEEHKPFISREQGAEIRSGAKIEGDKIVIPKEQMEITPEQKEHIDMIERHHEAGNKVLNGELDFESVADNQISLLDQIAEQEEDTKQEEDTQQEEDGSMLEFDLPKNIRFFTPEQTKEYLGDSVLPMAIYEGTNEENVVEVQFIDSVQLKSKEGWEGEIDAKGLPLALTIQSVKPNGEVVIGKYRLESINQPD